MRKMMTAEKISPSAPVTSPAFKRRGMMLVLASPPGGGKTTISREIMRLDPSVTVSVSATTRAKRPGEVEGRHYYFVSREDFQAMAAGGGMLEHAEVYNHHFYGTPRAPVEKALADGRDVLFDIDWQGNQSLKAIMPADVVSVFLLPPSWHALAERLHNRAQDSEDEIARRLGKAQDEISHYREFDYVIVNADLQESIASVQAIITAERHKRARLTDVDAFVQTLKP